MRLEDDWVPMDDNMDAEELERSMRRKEAQSRAVVLEMVYSWIKYLVCNCLWFLWFLSMTGNMFNIQTEVLTKIPKLFNLENGHKSFS